jgi:hypothetical protein
MTGPVGRAYYQLVKAHELKPDPAQERAYFSSSFLTRAITASGVLTNGLAVFSRTM